jgi:wyosine [tRNA(Phe)-imidazoG37] synthetase (radical SAM superfamily)
MALETPLFADHSRRWQENRYVYPVISRRSRGLSIGVNLNPDGACNFDCAYCCVDRTEARPGREVDLAVVRQELAEVLSLVADGGIWRQAPFDTTPGPLRRFNDIAFSGDGEPTSFPEFGAACQVAIDLVEWIGSPARIVVITNATLLHQERVQQAFDRLGARGEIWAKLDAGTESLYRLMDRSDVPFSRILANLLAAARRRPLVIQTLFAKCHGQAPDFAEISAYLARLTDIRTGGGTIDRVQIYTTARSTTESWVTPLAAPEVDAIVAAVRAVGFQADPFYGPV